MKLISGEMAQKFTQTYGVRNEIDQILSPILFTQRIYGQQILNPKWSWISNALSHIYISFLVVYVLAGTFDFIQNNDDYVLFFEAVFTVIITVELPIKYMFFVCYRTTFGDVYVIAKTLFLNLVFAISPQKGPHLVDRVRKIVKLIFAMSVTPTVTYLIIALWSYFNGTRVTLSRTTSIIMPMTSPYYEIGLILHLNYLFMAGFLIIVVDFWFVLLIYFLCEACECATEILQVNRVRDESNILYANRLNEALGKFYFVHVKLMRYLKMLNTVYEWPHLVSMSTMLVTTCLFLLVMTEEPNWQLSTVMVPTTVKIFALNTLGEAVKSRISDMQNALVNFDWINLKLKDKKNYNIIICYMNKEFGIRNAVGTELSLLTLSNLYKGSYQFFAVLNTMKS